MRFTLECAQTAPERTESATLDISDGGYYLTANGPDFVFEYSGGGETVVFRATRADVEDFAWEVLGTVQ